MLPSPSRFQLGIFDALGRRVKVIAAGVAVSDVGRAHWDLQDEGGRRVSGGVYFLRLRSERGTLSQPLVVMP
jgi:hypothetical protein